MRGLVAQPASSSAAQAAMIHAAVRRVAIMACPPSKASAAGACRFHPDIRAKASNRRDGRMNGSFTPGRRLSAYLLAGAHGAEPRPAHRSEEHTSELQSRGNLVCRLRLGKKSGSL